MNTFINDDTKAIFEHDNVVKSVSKYRLFIDNVIVYKNNIYVYDILNNILIYKNIEFNDMGGNDNITDNIMKNFILTNADISNSIESTIAFAGFDNENFSINYNRDTDVSINKIRFNNGDSILFNRYLMSLFDSFIMKHNNYHNYIPYIDGGSVNRLMFNHVNNGENYRLLGFVKEDTSSGSVAKINTDRVLLSSIDNFNDAISGVIYEYDARIDKFRFITNDNTPSRILYLKDGEYINV